MGIPHYFKHVTQEMNDIVTYENPQKNCERLFLDFNCAIHRCSNELKKYNNQNNIILDDGRFENELISRCEKFIQEIFDFIQPTKLLYVSIDGVVPMAKISQQRKRRYFSDWKKQRIRKTLLQHNNLNLIKKLDQDWNTNQITPGTSFMEHLIETLTLFVNEYSIKIKREIILDASPGEGEHKICHYIRSNSYSIGDMIYGMDADMILLGMLSSNVENTVLLREDMKKNDLYIFMKLKETSEQIYNQFSKYINDVNGDKTFLIKCYVFLTFLLGNDFLPNLTYIHLRENGLVILLNIYSKCFEFFQYEQHILIETSDGNVELNAQFFDHFIDNLQRDENDKMKILNDKYYSDHSYNNKNLFKRHTNDDFIKSESDRLEKYPHMYKFPKGLIDLNKPGWRIHYYYHLFEKTNSSYISSSACREYFNGLIWMIDYYFKQSTNWDWFYPFNYSPTMLDFYNYIQVNENIEVDLTNKNSVVINEEEQLLMVIPPSSKHDCFKSKPHLLRYYIDKKSPLLHTFPTNFEILTYCKSFLHECGGVGINMKSRIDLEKNNVRI